MSSPPVKYLRYFDFTNFATLNPEKPLPGASVDVEYNRLKVTTDQTIDRLSLIQNDDGTLKGVIGTAQLADGAVTEPKLATGAVSARALGDGQVSTLKIAPLAVDNSRLALLSVATSTLQDLSVSTAKLQDGSVTGPKIAPGSLQGSNLAPGSIGSTQLQDGGVQTVDLADLSVTQGKLALLSVGTPQLIDAAVTSAKLAASLALAGIPTAPTPATGTNTTQLATTAFVAASMSAAGAITEAPNDGALYGRQALGWQLGVKLAGDIMTGPLQVPQLRLGGATAAFPMWKNIGAVLHARLADDSALANVQVAALAGTDLSIDANINGPAIGYEINRSVGANARTGWLAFNNLHYGGILHYGPNYGPGSGPDRADGTSVTATGTGGLSNEVTVAGAPVDWWLGGAKKMSLDAVTGLLVGTSDNALLPVRASNVIGANKVINGDFRIHQRGLIGTVYTAPAGSLWVADRWAASATLANKVSSNIQYTPGAQNTARLLIQSLTNNVPALGDQYYLTHKVEGYNCNDLEWGGATAKPITVSFMAYVNNAGNYGGAIHNGGYGAAYRNYPFSFNLTANAWNKVVVTIPGDTGGAGNWGQDNSIGMMLILNLGTGSNYLGPANVWGANFLAGPTGAFNMLGIAGAVMYLANVKIETGNIATPFVPDDYQVSLAKCQRYGWKWLAGQAYAELGVASFINSNQAYMVLPYPVVMRALPAMQVVGAFRFVNGGGGSVATPALAGGEQSVHGAGLAITTVGGFTANTSGFVSANNNAASSLFFDAEL